MDKSTPIVLINKAYTKDSIGQLVPTESRRTCFASIKSVSSAEFFSAGERGFKPQYVASMFLYDYQGEDTCELSMFGVTSKYAIYRTYITKSEIIELYLERRVGD